MRNLHRQVPGPLPVCTKGLCSGQLLTRIYIALPAGVSEAGITEGDPILIIVPNKTQRSQDYSEMEVAYRCFLLCCVQGGACVFLPSGPC